MLSVEIAKRRIKDTDRELPLLIFLLYPSMSLLDLTECINLVELTSRQYSFNKMYSNVQLNIIPSIPIDSFVN